MNKFDIDIEAKLLDDVESGYKLARMYLVEKKKREELEEKLREVVLPS